VQDVWYEEEDFEGVFEVRPGTVLFSQMPVDGLAWIAQDALWPDQANQPHDPSMLRVDRSRQAVGIQIPPSGPALLHTGRFIYDRQSVHTRG